MSEAELITDTWGRPFRPFKWHRRTPGHRNVGPTCPDCQTIHGADAAVAVGRFTRGGARGYRSRLGGPVRRTREAAVADFCAERRGLSGPRTTAS